jgi:nicotinamidase-related amidase
MKLDLSRTALLVTDPQVDFLSPKSVIWDAAAEGVRQQNAVENLERLFAAAKASGVTVAISPHYYYPTDKGWKLEGALEKLMHNTGMFKRRSPYSMEGFENSGADFMPQYKQYILDNKTIIIVTGHSPTLRRHPGAP